MMKRLFFVSGLVLSAVSSLLAQDYKVEPIANPAPNLPAAYTAVISPQGYRVSSAKGAWVEIWMQKSIPTGAKPSDDAIVFRIAQGTLLGILRFPADGYDRRGQTVKAGVYTMRYSAYPVDGAHQGVAPQRDFALLTPIGDDADAASTPNYDALVQISLKASGTPHPAVLSIEPPVGTEFPSISKEGDSGDQVLNLKVGELPIGIIVVGKVQG